jgi:hypothetical protein
MSEIDAIADTNSEPLIKSPVENLPQDIQRNHQQNARIRDGSGHPGSWCVRVFWHQLGTKLMVPSFVSRYS